MKYSFEIVERHDLKILVCKFVGHDDFKDTLASLAEIKNKLGNLPELILVSYEGSAFHQIMPNNDLTGLHQEPLWQNKIVYFKSESCAVDNLFEANAFNSVNDDLQHQFLKMVEEFPVLDKYQPKPNVSYNSLFLCKLEFERLKKQISEGEDNVKC